MTDEVKKIDARRLSREPTLSKFGADLRWLCEKSGIDPETVVVSIGVKTNVDQSAVLSTFLREFNGATMRRYDKHPHMVVMHGVPVWIICTGKEPA